MNETRRVLGDLTNRPGKRDFSKVLGDSGVKSGDGYCHDGDEDLILSKKVCLGAGKVREKCPADLEVGSKEKQPCKSLSISSGNSGSEENVESLNSDIAKEFKIPNVSDGDVHQSVLEVANATRDGCLSGVSMATSSQLRSKECSGFGGNCPSDAAHRNLIHEGLVTNCKNSEEALASEKLGEKKCGSTEWPRLPRQGSKFHELGRCATLKNDGVNAGDLLKNCSCSFCMKAAYIWSDLQYQDIKGRITASKKSQKEAHTLLQNTCVRADTDIHSRGNPKSSKLEYDLMGHWRSLFCHMEDIFAQENNQFQTDFVALKDLREKCKTDLEMFNGQRPAEKH
ncbi:hypothetical protein UlMin_038235 [Ulmus minor]